MRLALGVLVLCVSCSAPDAVIPEDPRPARQDGEIERLRQRERELTQEADRIRAEASAARLELFTLRLRVARLEGKADEENRLLRESGLRSPHEPLRIHAIRIIGALPADRQRAFLEDLAGCARTGTPPVRAEAVAALGRVAGAESHVLQAARDADADVRRAAALTLRSGSADAIEELIRLIGDPAPPVRLAALESAGATRSERTLAAIIRAATGDGDPAVAERAIDVLGSLASPAAAVPLQQVLASTQNDSIRWSTINALGKVGVVESAGAIRPFLGRDRPVKLREIAAQVLGKLRDRESVAALVEAVLNDPGLRVREGAARALGRIGGATVVQDALLPAVLDDPEPAVCRAAWEAALEASAGRFADLHLLAITMLRMGRRAEVEEVCKHLHVLKLEGSLQDDWMKLEEKVVESALAARDFRAALGHLVAINRSAPKRPDVLKAMARAHRQLAEYDAALSAVAEALACAKAGEPLWWEARLEFVTTLEATGAHARVIEESQPSLNGSRPPEGVVQALERARLSASGALIQGLLSEEPAVRKQTLEAIRPLGKKIILTLAQAVTDTSLADRKGILEAGNAITGTAFADLGRSAEIAEAWKSWASK